MTDISGLVTISTEQRRDCIKSIVNSISCELEVGWFMFGICDLLYQYHRSRTGQSISIITLFEAYRIKRLDTCRDYWWPLNSDGAKERIKFLEAQLSAL